MHRFFRVLAADVLAKGCLALVALALIRYLDPREYAGYTFAVAISTAAAQTLAGGFGRIYVVGYQSLAIEGRDGSFLGLQAVLVLALAAAAWPLVAELQANGIAIAMLALGTVLAEFARSYYQRRLEFDRLALLELFRALLQAAAIGVLLSVIGADLTAAPILLAQALALTAAFALSVGTGLRRPRLCSLVDAFDLARGIWRGGHWMLLAYFAVVAMFSQLDVFMVKLLASEQVLAAYGAAFRYYAILSLALGAAHTVLLPMVQRAETMEDSSALFRQHLKVLALFAPAVLGLALTASWLLPLIDQGRYPESIAAFRILALSSIISFAFSPHVNLLLKLERFGFLLGLICLAFLAAALLHLLLIPRFGAAGAAFATLLASSMVTVPIFAVTRKRLALRVSR